MSKRSILWVLVLALALSGCQLAKPEAQEEAEKDMLVGVFMTQEYLDLFDFDAYFQDHAGDLLTDGAVSADHLTRYGSRIWGERIRGSDGHSSYHFGDLEGHILASFRILPENDPWQAYWSSEVSGALCDVSLGHHSIDNGARLELSAAVWFSDTHPDPGLYFNPIYQTPDGRVYVVSGQGMFFGEGSATQTMTEEVTRTEQGVKTGYSTRIHIAMDTVSPARRLVLLQMDEENRVLHRLETTPGEAPRTLTPEAGCAYLLLEEHTAGGIRRSIFQKEDSGISFFRELSNGLCEKGQITLSWPE